MAGRPVTILAYHSVGDAADPYTITPGAFERQLETLVRHYRIVRLRDLPALLRDPAWNDRCVVLTFDDALRDFLTEARPLLERVGAPCTMFVPTAYLGRESAWDAGSDVAPKPIMTAAELAALPATGLVDVGSHTVDHVRMAQIPEAAMRHQAMESRRRLEEIVPGPVELFSYPYGMLDDFSHTSERVLAEAGYRVAVTAHWGTRARPGDLLRLRRIAPGPRDGPEVLRQKVEGRYDWIAAKERLGYFRRRLLARPTG